MSEQKTREAYVQKLQAELNEVACSTFRAEGNAFCSVLFVGAFEKGLRFSESVVGEALISAYGALGFAPGSWAAIDCTSTTLNVQAIRTTLQPSVIIAYDETGLQMFGDNTMQAGELRDVFGIQTLWLGDFKAALKDSAQKRIMWERLQQVRANERGM